MDDDAQTREELQAQYAEGGAVDVCFRFLACIFEHRSYDEAWPLMDDNLRLCRAQAWIWNNREYPDIAGRLDERSRWLAEGPHPGEMLWDQFSAIELAGTVEAWGELYARELGAASRPRPVGPDLELVILAPTDGQPFMVSGPTLLSESLTWTVGHSRDGFRISNWSDRLPVPGLPPDLYPDVV